MRVLAWFAIASGLFEAAAAVLQIGCDPGRPERVVADLRGDASRSGAPANHTISVRLRHRRARRSRHRPSRFEADDSALARKHPAKTEALASSYARNIEPVPSETWPPLEAAHHLHSRREYRAARVAWAARHWNLT